MSKSAAAALGVLKSVSISLKNFFLWVFISLMNLASGLPEGAVLSLVFVLIPFQVLALPS